MTYSATVPTVYAVFFEEPRVLKVGVSGEQRWRNFLARGADLVATQEFSDMAEARIFELRNHHHLSRLFIRGFASRDAAAPFLGLRGDGWTESYRLPTGVDPMGVLRELPDSNGVAKSGDAIAESMPRTDGRTNERITHHTKTSLVGNRARVSGRSIHNEGDN